MGLQDDLQGLGRKAGGSHLTKEARERHLREFARWCKENNYQIQRADQIKEKHIRGYMDSLREKNSERTRQNKLSALRVVIAETGKTKFADGIKTRSMGVQQASRTGTKRAMTEDEYRDALGRVEAYDKGVAAAVALCRALGLRRTEAVCADARTLKRWLERIDKGRDIDVFRGTKGGRHRQTMYPDQDRAREAVAVALRVAHENGGHLIKMPGGGLKESVKRMENVAARSGLKGKTSLHSLRYAFACERLDQLVNEGYSRREAATLVSEDLGHGDGRGAYIEQVYSRR